MLYGMLSIFHIVHVGGLSKESALLNWLPQGGVLVSSLGPPNTS